MPRKPVLRSPARSKPSALLPPAPEHYAEASELAGEAARPARTGSFRFGAAGWADPALSRNELFYPKQVRTPEARLRHYAEHFSLVEVDATFYALLAVETVAHWADWTPDGFEFDVKAHPVFTGHRINAGRLPADLARLLPNDAGQGSRSSGHPLPLELTRELERRFFASLLPLVERGRLKSILVQFPPWFEATRGNARYLEQLRERYPEAPFSVEFRHRSWLDDTRRERVVALLRAQRLAYVVVDEPDVERAGVPPLPLVTSPRLAVVRFHGQNAAAWQNPRASLSERFNYLYSRAELSGWRERLRVLADGAEQVHAVFTNGARDFAILNAKGLCALMQGASIPTASAPDVTLGGV